MGNTAEERVVIRNIYYMMAYAFRAIELREFESLKTEDFEHANDLLAAILAIGISTQVKRGLEKGYVEESVRITGARGRIDAPGTARLSMRGSSQTQCSVDDFNEDVLTNQIMKACAHSLVGDDSISEDTRLALKRCLIHLQNVSLIPLSSVRWDALKFHRNNASYQILMNVCKMIIEGKLLTQQAGEEKLASFISDRKLSSLYEHFVLEYFKLHHPDIKASAKVIKGSIENASLFLPELHTDITLEGASKTLIIDTKCYGQILHAHFDKEALSNNNVNQIFHYVISESYVQPDKTVSGMLLYAKTDKQDLNTSWQDANHSFYCRTLDLNREFKEIAAQLDEIANLVK